MNPIKNRGTKIFLDRERYLKFDFNTLIDLEDVYGSLEKFQEALTGNPSMKDIRRILYHSLKHEDDKLTEVEVGKFINFDNLKDIMDAFMESYNSSFPELSEEDKEKAKN